MTLKQKILQTVYPAFIRLTRLFGLQSDQIHNEKQVKPPESFYNLSIVLNDGSALPFASLKGKKVLLVNTASDCGYTPQYTQLQSLHNEYKDRVCIIGFPSNDFKEQEKRSDREIEAFCRLQYGITFMLARKSSVRKGLGQNAVFAWLTDKRKNGWNEQEPIWNFSKYLVDEEGILQYYFDPSVDPESTEMRSAVENG